MRNWDAEHTVMALAMFLVFSFFIVLIFLSTPHCEDGKVYMKTETIRGCVSEDKVQR